MRLGSPFDALHEAIGSAIHRDLPAINYEDRDWEAWRKMSKPDQDNAIRATSLPRDKKTCRPMSDEVEVIMFPQTWGSTALGYGGIGGCPMTPAYTVIVIHRDCYCVYFGGGRLAYKLELCKMSPEGRANMLADIACRCMEEVHKSGRYK